MRTQHLACRPTAELTSPHIQCKNALRAALPAGVIRPDEVADLGLSAAAHTSSPLAALTDLAHAILADVEHLTAKSSSSRSVFERSREGARDQAI